MANAKLTPAQIKTLISLDSDLHSIRRESVSTMFYNVNADRTLQSGHVNIRTVLKLEVLGLVTKTMFEDGFYRVPEFKINAAGQQAIADHEQAEQAKEDAKFDSLRNEREIMRIANEELAEDSDIVLHWMPEDGYINIEHPHSGLFETSSIWTARPSHFAKGTGSQQVAAQELIRDAHRLVDWQIGKLVRDGLLIRVADTKAQDELLEALEKASAFLGINTGNGVPSEVMGKFDEALSNYDEEAPKVVQSLLDAVATVKQISLSGLVMSPVEPLVYNAAKGGK